MSFRSPRLGQLLVFGFDGHIVPQYIKSLVEDENLGGVILFSRNGNTPQDFQRLSSEISANSALKPFIFIDQEGGRVTRIRFDGLNHSSAEELAAPNDIILFRKAIVKMTKALAGCGIDVNTIPVLDMPSRRDIPVLQGRCYGSTPQEVIKFSSVVIDIYLESGQLCCAKHFPGLGDVTIDPHFDLPEDDTLISRYYQHKFLPFEDAIARKIPMIMTTHVVAKALDGRNPATFSSKLVRDTLIGQLGFDGLVVSDDLEMGAICKKFAWRDVIINTLMAGHQLLLICHSQEKQKEALDHIQNQVRRDNKFRLIVEKAIEKVLGLKREHFRRK